MKYTKLLVLFYVTWLFSIPGTSGQSTWWVSNRNDGVIVDFTDLGAAYNAASAGDTLIIYPSPYDYGTLTMSKEVHIKGIGYRIDTLNQPALLLKTFSQPVVINGVSFTMGSDGSSIESVYVAGGCYLINTSNVSIYRTEITGSIGTIHAMNSIISGCYLSNSYTGNGNNPILNLTDSSNNNTIRNNIFGTVSCCNNGSVHSPNSINNAFLNNIITTSANVNVSNSLLYNNIFVAGNVVGQLNDISHNIFMTGNPGMDANGNIYGATDVFVGYPGQGGYSFDSRWQLSPGSPAIGAGFEGEDCGVFGGPNPYKLSGIHNRPLIYELTIPPYIPEGSDLPVVIKVRAEN